MRQRSSLHPVSPLRARCSSRTTPRPSRTRWPSFKLSPARRTISTSAVATASSSSTRWSLLTAGAGCAVQPDTSATCEAGTTVVEAHLRDRDDTAHVLISGTARVWAGSGNDHVIADSFSSATFVYGEGGDDDIAANGEGGQLADGGSGNDIVHAGGFAGNGTGLGGSGTDLIRFQTVLGGEATLDGGTGDDTIVSQPAGGTATGGIGDDIIAIHGLIPLMSGDGLHRQRRRRRRHDHRRHVCRHDSRRRRTGLHRRPQRRRGHRRLRLRTRMSSVSTQPTRLPRTARSSSARSLPAPFALENVVNA